MKKLQELAVFLDVQIEKLNEIRSTLHKPLIDYSKISNVEIEDIDTRDYPEFCDAFISSCDIDGEPDTDEELDEINQNGEFVYECILRKLL